MYFTENHTDDILLKMLRKGSESAFEEIYLRYWRSCYHTAFKVFEDEDTCLDVLQDVFVWLWENRDKIQAASLKAYLCTAVKFKMINVVRHNKVCDAAMLHFRQTGTAMSFMESSLEVKELKEMLNQFIDSLPPQAGKIFHLSRNEQLSNKEIALRLNLSEKTVKNQIHLSLKKLKSTLGHLSFWAGFFL